MKKVHKYLLIAFATTGLVFGCSDDVLDVANENDPDFAKVYATGTDVENVTSGLYNAVFNAENSYSGVQMMLATAADHVTCSWGNSGMRDMSWEPRDFAWDNTPTYANAGNLAYTYNRLYSAIGTASNVLKAIESGVQIGPDGSGNARTAAFAKFILGMAYADFAMIFDRAHVVDNVKTAEPTLETALPYDQVADAAQAYFDEALQLASGSFVIPSSWMGTSEDLSIDRFKMVINTHAARLLAYVPRNKTQLAAVDWAKVKTYADAGIDFDLVVENDGYNNWYSEAGDYLTYPGWGRTDMYVAHMMEPSLPQHWEDNASFPHPAEPATSLDARLKTDFQYLGSNDFNPTRGYYHFSCYRSKRYDDVYAQGVGPKPTVLKAENDMLKAEARAYLGDLTGAAQIINAGTRVTRGELDPVAANLADIVDAIHHERHVEMFTTGCGLQFFEMRKLDLLQKGTPLHLPIPGSVLQLFGLTEFYTFGKTATADGINVSNGGWR